MSPQARELGALIDWQDTLYTMALTRGADQRLLNRIRTQRNTLVREWGAQVLKDQFLAVGGKVGA